jgi:hypothetical protein
MLNTRIILNGQGLSIFFEGKSRVILDKIKINYER